MFSFTLEQIKKNREKSRKQFPDGDLLLLADLDSLSKEEVFQVFEKYNFRDQVGCPLTNNLHFLELVELAFRN